MFRLTSEPVDPPAFAQPHAGGVVIFEGLVRDHAEGRAVLRLEYEAYPELAVAEGNRLVAEAIERFGLTAAEVIHRTGMLEIGDVAVWIRTAAAHRREAFAGCEWIIDQLKVRVPIWKRETYADGDSGWIGADAVGTNPDFDRAFLERQIRLDEVGEEGQARLAKARVLLVGVGGLGCASLPYLCAAGIGTLGIADPDSVEISNLHRQILYQAQEVGRSKVERAAAFARKLRPTVQIETYVEPVHASNVESLVRSYDWVVDGTDSLAVKQRLNRACRAAGVPLTTASVHRFEGHLATVAPGGPCLECLFDPWPVDGCVSTCAETGVMGFVPGTLGILQAAEVIQGLLNGHAPLASHLLLVDLRNFETRRLARSVRPGCPACAGEPISADPLQVSTLAEASARFGSFELVDIRESDEAPPLAQAHRRIAGSSLRPEDLHPPSVLVCATGKRSLEWARRLQGQGLDSVVSLEGGLRSA